MATKENIGIMPSGAADTRIDEMANAKGFEVVNVVVTRALKCTNRPRPGTCLGPKPPPGTPRPCIVPPKCGTGPCKNKL